MKDFVSTGDVGNGERRVGPDTIPGNATTTETIAVGVTEIGEIGPTDLDQDWYRVELTAGRFYEISLTGDGAAPLDDPLVRLYDSAGRLVASDDDGGDGFDSLLAFTPTTDGAYFVSAGAFDYPEAGNVGQYALGIDEAAPPERGMLLKSIDWGSAVAGAEVIEVYFAADGETFGGETPVGWTGDEIAAAMNGFRQISNVVNVSFEITTDAAAADFRLVAGAEDSDALGFFNPPGEADEGVGWFNTLGQGWDAAGLKQGGYGFITLIHEFGHGMGLAHPHDAGGTSVIMEGVTAPFGSYGLFGLNQGVFTTMSYNDGYPLSAIGASTSDAYGWQGTMMALDVAVLQEKYGANTDFRSGDDFYVLPSADAAGAFYSCLWDSGGADAIRHIGPASAFIDLRAATLEYEAGGGGFVSSVAGVFGGFTIAKGAVIENATGGTGADRLIGNAAANVLNGGAGADDMRGGAGNDRFIVDDLGDVVYEAADRGIDAVISSISHALADNVESLTLNGTSSVNAIGNGIANVLVGNSGANLLAGAAGADQMRGGLGGDTYTVENAGDAVVEAENAGTDLVFSSISLTLAANVENLTLVGTRAIDGAGNALANALTGNAGRNTLDGGLGADRLTGGAGADVFLFGARLRGGNVDAITDFSVADDTIHVDDAVFAGLAVGALAAGALMIGAAAADAADRFIYDGATGNLFFDRDGTGAAAAIRFAVLDTGLGLTQADFFVV